MHYLCSCMCTACALRVHCVVHAHLPRTLSDQQAPELEAARVEVAPSLRGALGVITCDLEKAENAGSLCRLLSNFAAEGASLVHVHTPRVGATAAEAEATQTTLLRSNAMALAGRHAHRKLARTVVSLDDFLPRIATWPRPIVVIETAEGAVDIHGFLFPPQCDVLVGGETRGVHPSLLAALRPGTDAIVYIPMPGFARSMNVASAACAALYEHRRQHPQ